jgi:hypothetical protein
MKYFLRGLSGILLVPFVMSGCGTTQTPQKSITTPDGKRIYLPQENLFPSRQAQPKVTPYSYNSWITLPNQLSQVREYEMFLERNGVGSIIPSFELMRTARDWQKCGRMQYMVPNRELWNNQVTTLKVFKYLVATQVLTDFEVTSVYRDLPLNQCAGGANSSRHLYNSAIDFRIGPTYPIHSEDFAFVEHTKYKLCQFWHQHGQSFNMGLGVYSTGQIHIDTFGYRTWGPDGSRKSSPCNYN